MQSLTLKYASLLVASSVFVASASAQTLYTPGGTVGNITGSNVGIGTATPTEKLDVNGTANVNLLTVKSEAFLTWYAPSEQAILGHTPSSWDSSIRVGSDSHQFWVGASPRMTITSSGNVGIGNSSPTDKLQIGTGLTLHDGGHKILAFGWSPTTGQASMTGYPAAVRWDPTGGYLAFNVDGTSRSAGQGVVPTERMRIGKNGNVGIATTGPNEPLEIGGSGRMFIGDGGGSSRKGLLIDAVEDGTYVRLHPYDYASGTSLNLVISPFSGGNVGIGTTTPTNKLEVNGTIRAKEVVIEASPWPDDVFAPGYALPTVEDVATHITSEGHLPGVPSAATVADQGVAVGEMQKTLLRKMEEMTLYIIAQNHELADLRAQNAALAARVENLEKIK